MKKCIPFLALFLLALLVAQSALAASLGLEMFYDKKPMDYPQNATLLTGVVRPSTSGYNEHFAIRLSPTSMQTEVRNSFLDYYADNAKPLESGYIRKALYVDMGLRFGDQEITGPFTTSDSQSSEAAPIQLKPLLPVDAFIPKGTRFKNLTVYHLDGSDRDSLYSWEWDNCEAQVFIGKPKYDQNGISSESLAEDAFALSSPNNYLTFSLTHFSPFVIVWDELDPAVLSAIESLPDTGDHASLLPWLLLLGASALLLAKKGKTSRV